MNNHALLTQADVLRLQNYLENTDSKPRPDASQKAQLEEILRNTLKQDLPRNAPERVGLDQRVLLVSEKDAEDFYSFTITLPHEADLEADKISLLRPLSLAALGREVGQSIEWETPGGIRKMQITSVSSDESAGALAV